MDRRSKHSTDPSLPSQLDRNIFFHLSVGSIVSSYTPASMFSQLACSVSLSAGAASVTGDAMGLIYAARRRDRRDLPTRARDVHVPTAPELEGGTLQETGDKPQLHSDHLPPRYLYEMDGSAAPSQADGGALPEMAANEAPARELAADRHHSPTSIGGEDVLRAETSVAEHV